ncbi:hypothetical protein [Novosphingobium sp. Chol11]|uniref:hypothetical protein n=1 Tax=Novosphingobium sp. Chol11 TaxID=1385763 RepID=UPI000BE28B84|nr:hypothetical protein [Novosphingobium sp. Chol11]
MTAQPHREQEAVTLSWIITAVLACDPQDAVEYRGQWVRWGDLQASMADLQAQLERMTAARLPLEQMT